MHLTFGVLNHSHSSFQKLKICEIIKISEIIKFNDLCQNILNCELVKIGQTPIIKSGSNRFHTKNILLRVDQS